MTQQTESSERIEGIAQDEPRGPQVGDVVVAKDGSGNGGVVAWAGGDLVVWRQADGGHDAGNPQDLQIIAEDPGLGTTDPRVGRLCFDKMNDYAGIIEAVHNGLMVYRMADGRTNGQGVNEVEVADWTPRRMHMDAFDDGIQSALHYTARAAAELLDGLPDGLAEDLVRGAKDLSQRLQQIHAELAVIESKHEFMPFHQATA